jgi:hypothetical protein
MVDVSQLMMPTSETQRRISERQVKLLGEIGVLDWHIKQLTAQQEAKYREIEAMMREQPFIQQLELDLIDKYRDHPQRDSNGAQPEVTGGNGISQSETVAAPPVTVTPSPSGGEASAPARRAKRAASKRPAKKPAVKRPAPKPAPVAAVAATPPKRGRGRPRKQPPIAAAPLPVDITPAHAGNGTDLDAAFGAM